MSIFCRAQLNSFDKKTRQNKAKER
ncbi:hypothetical protein JL09_g6351 [Pichia kudriavzevii]|uniref:Uncharacterized protein n=1 Tax=Pichia kudriavzevii TaxID=4909 RepID=A0A099NRD8_PICKU|nr:hypothetical protein JL09_g6351 [Pichia kudriavzevii]